MNSVPHSQKQAGYSDQKKKKKKKTKKKKKKTQQRNIRGK
jgi:hypothetical protein